MPLRIIASSMRPRAIQPVKAAPVQTDGSAGVGDAVAGFEAGAQPGSQFVREQRRSTDSRDDLEFLRIDCRRRVHANQKPGAASGAASRERRRSVLRVRVTV